jgi:Rrf2 family transcriptional regulator, nitric oxide-sensitive transcriptional repressor
MHSSAGRVQLQLTLHADYSLRVLLYLAENPDRVVPTQEISEAYSISRNHLVRVIQTLDSHSFVKVVTGRGGGVALARDPSEINLGQVIRRAESGFRIVECFDLDTNTCPIVPACKLRGVMRKALESFFNVLDGYTLADLVRMPRGRRISDFLPAATLGARPLGRVSER